MGVDKKAAGGSTSIKRKKIDNRIRVLIQNGVAKKQRSMFVVVGPKAKEQVSRLSPI